jgi:hypothetical protein
MVTRLAAGIVGSVLLASVGIFTPEAQGSNALAQSQVDQQPGMSGSGCGAIPHGT